MLKLKAQFINYKIYFLKKNKIGLSKKKKKRKKKKGKRDSRGEWGRVMREVKGRGIRL